MKLTMNTTDTFEHVKKTSMLILSKDKFLQPIAIAPSTIISLPTDRSELRMWMEELSRAMPWFVVVQEVWIASYQHGDDRAPSQRPDRAEAIMVMLVENGVHTRIAQCQFMRSNDGTIFFNDWIEPSNMQTTPDGVCSAISNP